MGVSLERVQYKFASIIGELCNEPFILSQFAVWLDLRLAEYKSRGSISLDCCGFLPDPDWLKGLLRSQIMSSEQDSQLEDISATGDEGESFYSMSCNVDTGGQFSPVNMVNSENASEHGVYSNTGNIHRRPMKMVNQNRRSNPHSVRGSSATVEMTKDRSADYIALMKVEDEVIDLSPNGQADQGRQPATNGPQRTTPSLFHTNPGRSLSQPAQTLGNRGRILEMMISHSSSESAQLGGRGINLGNHSNKRTAAMQGGRRNSTARNIAAAVSSFQRWLREEPYQDSRKMEDIPASELDVYLVDFFSTVKKPSGEDYTRRSYEVYRYSLDRYLKEKGYPQSICKSHLFSRSQAAFSSKKQSLREVAFVRSSALTASSQVLLGAVDIGEPEVMEFVPNTNSTACPPGDSPRLGTHGNLTDVELDSFSMLSQELPNPAFIDVNDSCTSPQENENRTLPKEGSHQPCQSENSDSSTHDPGSSQLRDLTS